MEAVAAAIKPANENVPAIRLVLLVSDPEVAHALGEHEEGSARDAFAKQALRIGVLATRQASGAVDAQSIQREGERILVAVREALTSHTSATTTGLAETLARQVGQESALFKLLSPQQADGLVATLSRAVGEALRVQRDEVLREFSRQFSLDQEGSAICKLMGAVGAFGESNARFQSDVRATLETFKVRREEAARSSLHGHSFEYAAGELLQLEAQHAGDVCERLSGVPGREGRKTGDYVVTLGPESAAPGARIVYECKAEKGYTEAQALEELALARKNREAQVGVFVVARESAKEGFATFRRVGPDVIVVWDADDPGTDVYLKAAVSIARALVVEDHRSSDQSAADLREVEQSIAAIERLVTTVESIAHDARNIVKKGMKIGKAAEGVKERLVEEVERLKGVVEGLGAVKTSSERGG
jgi:hypothetical protein